MACAEQDLWDQLQRLVIGDQIHGLPLGISELADSGESAHLSFQRGWQRFAARATPRDLGAVRAALQRETYQGSRRWVGGRPKVWGVRFRV